MINQEECRVKLEELKYGVLQEVSKELVNADVSAAIHWVSGNIMVSAKFYVLAQRLDEQTVSYPATWWQHFKQEFSHPGFVIFFR